MHTFFLKLFPQKRWIDVKNKNNRGAFPLDTSVKKKQNKNAFLAFTLEIFEKEDCLVFLNLKIDGRFNNLFLSFFVQSEKIKCN